MSISITDVYDELFEHYIAEYNGWVDAQGLPPFSADELVLEVSDAEQRAWLEAFIARWQELEEIVRSQS